MNINKLNDFGLTIKKVVDSKIISDKIGINGSGMVTIKKDLIVTGLIFKDDKIFKDLKVINIINDFGLSIFGDFQISVIDKDCVF